jgi:hypothetical protein
MKSGGEAPGEFTLAYLAIAIAGVLILTGERRAAKRIRKAERLFQGAHDEYLLTLRRVDKLERQRDELHFELDGDDVVDAGKTETPASGKTALEEASIDPESRRPSE